ncbi:lipopolysaccharide biosynthesis protein [Lactococcus lactis]|uniref:Lipopolysaccharide biosynthesis protein n=2 Tax=Lactococcus lactis TaxID=1358 RepID=A0AAJ4MK86_LACLL|nr:lipopolysaccharide biosynthesis protein [Lactococcus lactis]QRZ33792.1 lipopolysaccharide biosynthesis protein [Lactococcus lactis subsp. lactis]
MVSNISKSEVVSSLFWKFMERVGAQGIQFVVTIILGRLLLPRDFGIIALLTIFIAVANVFIQSGFSSALIQKKSTDNLDYSSVFYLSLFIAAIFYIILFLAAPIIATFYRNMNLIPILRVISLTLFPGAFNSIQVAYISKRLEFKKLFFGSFLAGIISGIIGISLAYLNFGVWALVYQQLISQISVCFILWFTVCWRPQLIFSFHRIKELFNFGWNILLSGLLNTVYNNIQSLIIGRVYSPAILGLYNRGQSFPTLFVTNIDSSIQAVLLPTMAEYQNDKEKVKNIVRRAIMTSSFFIFPLMLGLAVVAKPLVLTLLTDKWLAAVPFIQIFCIGYAVWPMQTANLQAIISLGYTNIYLKLEIIKKIIGTFIIVISVFLGVYAISWGFVIVSFISTFINAYPNLKLLNYSYGEQWKDILPSLILAIGMSALIYPIGLSNWPSWIVLISQFSVALIFYFGIAIKLKLLALKYIVVTFCDFLNKRG